MKLYVVESDVINNTLIPGIFLSLEEAYSFINSSIEFGVYDHPVYEDTDHVYYRSDYIGISVYKSGVDYSYSTDNRPEWIPIKCWCDDACHKDEWTP